MDRNLVIAKALAAVAEPFVLAGVMVRESMARRTALFEQMRLRELTRTDAAEPWKMGNIEIGNVAYGSLGTSAVHVAGTIYLSEIFLPRTKRVTGIGILNGATVGTDNLIAALFDINGTLLANSALAGTLSAGANAFQELPFAPGPIELKNDGVYYLGLQCSGTTATTRRIAASTFLRRTKTSTGTFGTLPTQAVPTSFVADAGPIGYVY